MSELKQCICICCNMDGTKKCPKSNAEEELATLKGKTDGGATVLCSDVLVAKLIEIDSLIRCVHLDMGGNDKYHISPRHNDQIGKLIKECLYIAEGN